uniref:Putative c2h2-type zn-finger protein n=1 Tax=Culex tarsalis TaxID=7177 RepID=A0A1Q3EZL2_CULTA
MNSTQPYLTSEVTIDDIKIEPEDEQEIAEDANDDGYTQEQQLLEPQDSHPADEVTKCETCNRFFDSKRGIKNHAPRCKGPDSDANPARLYTCEICSVSFKFRNSLVAHRNKHEGIKPYKCRAQCDKHFCSISLRTVHEKKCHGNSQICKFCDAKLSNEAALARHLSSQHAGEKHECEICGKIFAKHNKLALHQRMMHSNEEPKYPCEVCGKRFREARMLRRHMGCHMEDKPFKCELCNAGLSSKLSLKSHLKFTHGTASLQCQTCGSEFKNSSTLYTHRRMVHKEVINTTRGVQPKSVSAIKTEVGEESNTDSKEMFLAVTECETCHRFFDSKEGIVSHVLSCNELNETPDSLYTCHICTVSFRTPILLSAHLKDHKDEKLLKCRVVCEKWFYDSQKRDAHEKVCRVDKYSCQVCNTKLTNHRALWKHMNTVHVEPRHECEVCGKKFTRRTNLTVHQRIMHSENPPQYPCELCKRVFTQARKLRKHMEKHVKPEPC